jgi:hypothetical protein
VAATATRFIVRRRRAFGTAIILTGLGRTRTARMCALFLIGFVSHRRTPLLILPQRIEAAAFKNSFPS